MKRLKWVSRGIGFAIGFPLGLFILWDTQAHGIVLWRSAIAIAIVSLLTFIGLFLYKRWLEKIDEKFRKEFPFYMLTAVSYAARKRGKLFSLDGSDKPSNAELFTGLYHEQSDLVRRARELCSKIRSALPQQNVDLLEEVDPILTKFMQECMTYRTSHLNATPKFLDQYVEYVKSMKMSAEVPDWLHKEVADWAASLSLWSLTTKRLTWYLRPNKQDK